MNSMTQLKVRPEHLNGLSFKTERRSYKRNVLSLLGRFMRADKQEFTCQLVDISLGGARLLTNGIVPVGEKIIVHFNELGGTEGTVTRVFEGGFAVQFNITHRRRQKLAAQLTWLLNRHELDAADQRRAGHDRIKLPPKPVRIEFPDGLVLERNILDVSISGASIDTEHRPAIGSPIKVGPHNAKVVRHHSRGIGIEFEYIQQIEALREDFG